MKKKLGLLFIVLMLMLTLISCSSNPLDSVWKDNKINRSIDLLSNGSFISNNFFDNEIKHEGSYVVSEDDVLTIKSEVYGDYKYSYEIKGTELKLSQNEELVIELDKSERRTGYVKMIIGYALGFTVNLIGSYSIAIIVFTVFLKIVLLPISINQTKSTVKMNKVKPIVDKINEKYKHDKQKAQQKTMELYKKAKINPMAGCLPMIINMVLLIAFFRVLLYPDVFIYAKGAPLAYEQLSGSFLWIGNLTEPDLLAKLPLFANIIPENLHGSIPGIMPILTAIVTLFSFNSMTAGSQPQQGNAMMTSMKYVMPLMFLMLGARYPASLMIYWTVSSLFQMIQQPIIKKLVDKEVE
jgi:YidC/Oxa1 family membrane protein insertase